MTKNVIRTVFVCSPLRGTYSNPESVPEKVIAKNLALAKKLCLAVVKEGHAPFAPHVLYTAIEMDDKNAIDRAAGIAAGIAWLGQAAEIWVFADDIEQCSDGMRLEIERAEKFSIPPKVIFMPECWEQFRSELPPAKKKPTVATAAVPLRGAHLLPGEQV